LTRPLFHRVASPADIAVVANLAREIWVEHYVPIIGRAQVDYMLDRVQSESAIAQQINEGQEYYLISRDAPAGYFAVLPEQSSRSMFLSKIYVRKGLRGRGLGKAAVEFIEGLCRARSLRTLWLTVNRNNSASIAWYERMGFRNAGPVVKDIGGGFVMDDYRMEKNI